MDWTQIIIALMAHVTAVIILRLTQRSERQNIQKSIAEAKTEVNQNIGGVQVSVDQNTHITRYNPEAAAEKAAEKIEHKLTNGLGDHLAAKMAAAVKEKDREEIRAELMAELKAQGKLK